VAQCDSKVFFPDDLAQRPQFTDCPRQSQTTRRTFRIGDKTKGEPPVVNYVLKLCPVCAREWDEQLRYAERLQARVKAAGA
jgi:hypothetical protein